MTHLAEHPAVKQLLEKSSGDHRFISIWVGVVDGRVIVCSWNDKESGWYRAFLAEPNGTVRLTGREIAVRTIPLGSQRLNDAADDAYAAKYTLRRTSSM